MNIFILDTDIETCAQYHCDKHVVKMILESVQILCTALNKKGLVTPYKSTHQKHPCVLWAESSYDNFCWLKYLTTALNDEYRLRFDRQCDHKSMAVLSKIDHYVFEKNGLTNFAQAMPDKYKVQDSAVEAYRKFYLAEKMHFARWTHRTVPYWARAHSETKDR